MSLKGHCTAVDVSVRPNLHEKERSGKQTPERFFCYTSIFRNFHNVASEDFYEIVTVMLKAAVVNVHRESLFLAFVENIAEGCMNIRNCRSYLEKLPRFAASSDNVVFKKNVSGIFRCFRTEIPHA